MFTSKSPHFQAQRTPNVTDLSLPPEIGAIAPEASLYNDLRESERKIDWTMTRKVLELQDTSSKILQRRKTLRVFVTHTAQNQPWQVTDSGETPTVDFDSGRGIPSWELKIEGKLLEDGISQPTLSPSSSLPAPPPRKFSSFIKGIIVDMDRDSRLYPEDVIVEWHKNPALPAEDGFSIRRRGDVSLRVRILLHMDHAPSRFGVANPLGGILGIKQASQMEAITAMWSYIKQHGLQDKNDRRVVRADENLRTVFPSETILFQNVSELVERYLIPPEPIAIYHTIRVEPGEHQKTAAWDIQVDVDDTALKAKMSDMLTRLVPSTHSKVSALDEEISQHVQTIRSARLKQQFFSSFAEDHQQFIKTWMASQSSDLETILGTDRGVPDELMRRSDFFRLPWVEEAVAVHEGMRLAGALPYQAPVR